MTRLHYICVAILISSSLLFLATSQYSSSKGFNELGYAKVVTSITTVVVPDTSSSNNSHVLESDSSVVTEHKAISIVIVFCIALCFLVIFLVFREKKTYGVKDFQIPLIAISLMLGITYTSISINSGIFQI